MWLVYFGGQGQLLGIVSIGNEFLGDIVGYFGYITTCLKASLGSSLSAQNNCCLKFHKAHIKIALPNSRQVKC